MARLPGESERPTALYDLYAALDSEEAPLAAEEFRPYIERLIEADEHALAYAMQVDFLPEERIAMLGLLNNGGFEFPVSGLPFDWTIGSLRGARTLIVLEDSDRVLRVELFGGRVPFRHVWQHLLLQPGEYRLRGEVASAGLVTERGMQWVIACAEAQREVLLATERVSGTRPWTPFDATFTVPDGETCRAQEIRLILAARSPAEEEAEGEIRYDDLRIERVERPPGYAQPDRGDGDD